MKDNFYSLLVLTILFKLFYFKLFKLFYSTSNIRYTSI